MTSYLILPSLAAAQARSAQQATALGCEPGTTYWWAQVEHPATHQAALRIEGSGAYGPSTTADGVTAGLTTDETAALVPAASMDSSWFALGA